MTRTECPHGDPSCPCPDGLLCHYEGPDAYPPTAHYLRSLPVGSTVQTVGSTYWSKTGPDRWHRDMSERGRGRSSAWVVRHAKIIEVERSDVQVLRLLGEAIAQMGGY